MITASCDRADIRCGADAIAENLICFERCGTHSFDLLTAEQSQHAEGVQHRLVESVTGEFAEPGKIRLIFELEGPCDHALQVNVVALRQRECLAECFGGVRGVECAVAVSVLRVLFSGAGGTTFRVPLAKNDWRIAPLGK